MQASKKRRSTRPSVDLEVVIRARDGDHDAFAMIVTAYRDRIFGIAIGMLRNRDAAEDVVQETFIKAYKSLKGFRGEANIYTWLYRIAVNTAHNYLRQRRPGAVDIDEVAPVLETGDPDPSERVFGVEVGEAIEKAVSALPGRQREVFIFHYFEQMTHGEIAEALGISEGAVKAHYFHAVHKLKVALLPFVTDGEV